MARTSRNKHPYQTSRHDIDGSQSQSGGVARWKQHPCLRHPAPSGRSMRPCVDFHAAEREVSTRSRPTCSGSMEELLAQPVSVQLAGISSLYPARSDSLPSGQPPTGRRRACVDPVPRTARSFTLPVEHDSAPCVRPAGERRVDRTVDPGDMATPRRLPRTTRTHPSESLSVSSNEPPQCFSMRDSSVRLVSSGTYCHPSEPFGMSSSECCTQITGAPAARPCRSGC